MGEIKAILFDLDGTLLPMDQEVFLKAYMGSLCKAMMPHGYKSEELIATIWNGMYAMIGNDGEQTNEERFWCEFEKTYGEGSRADERLLAEFYEREFDKVSASCGYTELSRKIIDLCHARGFRVVLATNPVFPEIATQKRVRWAGLEPSHFELITHYGNSSHCKPNPDYYKEILEKIGLSASECIMVGNDVSEDMIARELGMGVFLLKNHIINKNDKDISEYPNGYYEDLLGFLGEV